MKNASLRKEFTIKRREHLIETDYIDGIYASSGEEVIRPLNDYEKEWLNQFYTETVHADYSRHPEIKRLNKIKNNIVFTDEVKKIMKTYPKFKGKQLRRIKEEVKEKKKQNIENNQEKYDEVMLELEQVKKAVMLTYDNKSEIYKENRCRNEDLYNKANITGKLKSFSNVSMSDIVDRSVLDEDPETIFRVLYDRKDLEE